MRGQTRSRGVRHLLRESRTDERGVTLVELAFVLLIMGILLAVTVPIVSTLVQTESKVDVTYANVDQQLWLSTTLQRLVRSAVAPTPSKTPATGPPVPAFLPGSVSPTSMTFYTDTGTPNGPERVTSSCTSTTSHATRCKVPKSTFTVKITSPKATSCPTVTGTYAKHCTYTSTTRTRSLVTITNVQNGAKTPPQPLFVYSYGLQPTPGKPMTITTVCAMTPPSANTPAGCTHTGLSTGPSPDARTFGTADTPAHSNCAASTNAVKVFKKCPAGEIEKVSYDLLINARTTSRYGGEQAEDDTGIFVLSSTSMLYDPSVG